MGRRGPNSPALSGLGKAGPLAAGLPGCAKNKHTDNSFRNVLTKVRDAGLLAMKMLILKEADRQGRRGKGADRNLFASEFLSRS